MDAVGFSDMLMAEPIRVFCLASQKMLEIDYPTTMKGWVYRSDICGPSLHRWDYADLFVLCGRQSTCSNAVLPRHSLCRTCSNKHWRLCCEKPCQTFYLSTVSDDEESTQAALSNLTFRSVSATDMEVQQYMRCIPKSNMLRKSASFTTVMDEKKLVRMIRSEQKFRDKIRSKSADDLTSALSESNCDSLLFDMLLTDSITPIGAYEKILNIFNARWKSGVFLEPNDVDFRISADTVSTVMPSLQLKTLFSLMTGRPQSEVHLFVMDKKLDKWLGYLTTTTRIVFGFYVPYGYRVYNSIYAGQPFELEGDISRVEANYATAVLRSGIGMRPIFVACYDGPTVTTEAMLPLGVCVE